MTTLVLENAQLKAAFNHRALSLVAQVNENQSRVLMHVSSLNRTFSVLNDVQHDQFRKLVQPQIELTPLMKGVAYLRVVAGHERDAYENAMRAHTPGFRIQAINQGKLEDAPEAGSYAVVELATPETLAVTGVDAWSRPAIAAALLRACGSGLTAATGPFRSQRDPSSPVVALVMPIHHRADVINAAQPSCERVAGYVLVAIDPQFLPVRQIHNPATPATAAESIEIYVGDRPRPENLLYRRPGSAAANENIASLRERLFGSEQQFTESWSFGGQRWHIRLQSNGAPGWSSHVATLLAFFAGLLLTFLVCLYLYVLRKRELRIADLMRLRTERLVRLRQMVAANALLDAERTRLLSLFEQAPGFIAVMKGPEHEFSLVNQAYHSLVGGDRELVGKRVRDALPEVVEQGFIDLLDKVYRSGEAHVGRGVPISFSSPADGMATHYVDFVYQPIKGSSGAVTGIFVQGTDVSSQKLTQDQLDYLATHDVVTGMSNLPALLNQLSQALTEWDGANERAPVLLLIGLKGMALVAQARGQREVELTVRHTAAQLKACATGSSFLARVGGSRFALLLPAGGGKIAEVENLARQLMNRVTENIESRDLSELAKCSIGIAVASQTDITNQQLLSAAESAMRQASEEDAGSIRFYTATLNQRLLDRLALVNALRRGVANKDFVLHYQPQVNLESGAVSGIEALLRWQHPERGLLGPESFIDLAEETGLIVQIGEWVLRHACHTAATWKKMGLGDWRITVNMSARQFAYAGVADTVHAALHDSGLAPRCLELELTESLVMVDVERTVETLVALKDLGVTLAIDDFGTGYSSLSYLKRFPIDVLKIDRAFVSGIPIDKNDTALSEAIISIGHSLGMRVVAEGVETEQQCNFLGARQCDEIQGFLFSPPVTEPDMEQLLRSSRTLPERLLRLHSRPGGLTSPGSDAPEEGIGNLGMAEENQRAIAAASDAIRGLAHANRNLDPPFDHPGGQAADHQANPDPVHNSERRLRKVIEMTPCGYLLASDDGRIVDVNPSLCAMTGYPRDALLNMSLTQLFGLWPCNDAGLASDESEFQNMEAVIVHKEGHSVHVLINANIVRASGDDRYAITAFLTDISDRKHAESRLLRLAHRDALTRLPNRAYLEEHVDQLLDSNEDSICRAIMFVDLDRFKEVNDSMGHQAGDSLLIEVAGRIRNALRPADMVARLGGDEFLVIATCDHGVRSASRIAEKLLSLLSTPVEVESQEIFIGASIGISLHPNHGQSREELFRCADMAMYRAKAEGRNCYRLYTESMGAHARVRATMGNGLHRAMERGQLHLDYQPRVSAKTMELTGFEALLRWTHPQLGVILPAAFIPIAEESGLIRQIDLWVIEQACWQFAGVVRRIPHYKLSVNLSASSLKPALLDQLTDILSRTGVPASALELEVEVTETTLLQDVRLTAKLLGELRALGVGVAVDDFGSGHSSLAYLRQLPVNRVNLDRSMLDGARKPDELVGFLAALVQLAHTLNLRVVCEGIETASMHDIVLRAGCDEIQGFLFARPMPMDDLLAFLGIAAKDSAADDAST